MKKKKEEFLDFYYIAFLNKPLNEIIDFLDKKYPEYTNFRFNMVINLQQMILEIYGTKK